MSAQDFPDVAKEFKNTDIIKSINIKSESDNIKIAVQTLMMISGEDNISNQNVVSFIVERKCYKEEDTLLYLVD